MCNIIEIPFDSQIDMEVNTNVYGNSILNTLKWEMTVTGITVEPVIDVQGVDILAINM